MEQRRYCASCGRQRLIGVVPGATIAPPEGECVCGADMSVVEFEPPFPGGDYSPNAEPRPAPPRSVVGARLARSPLLGVDE